MKPVAYISDGGVIFKESPLDSILKLSPLYTSAEIQELHNLFKEQQAEIEALKKELKRYAEAIGEERNNKTLRNNEIGKILTKVLDDCGLLKKASEK